MTDFLCRFDVNGMYVYIDRFKKYRTIEILQRSIHKVKYRDSLGVIHISHLFISEGSECFYIKHSMIKVDAYDAVDFV